MSDIITPKRLNVYRAVSPVFDYTVPAENGIYGALTPPLIGPQFVGRIKPAVSDGYWASIPPPTPGVVHTLVITAANSNGFSLNVTYKLTVA